MHESPRKKRSVAGRRQCHKIEPSAGSFNLSRRKLWCFRFFIAIGAPLVLIGTLVLFLRLVGFGYPTGFLLRLESDGKRVLVQNNQFGWRFFGAAMARLPQSF